MSVPKPDKSALGITKRVTELGISDFEISEENVTYYWLEITCSPASDGQPVVYMIPKRFSEFYELKTEYAKKYRSVKFPHFPSRSVFSALSPKDLLSRQANLQGYMSFLSHHVILRDDPLLEDFLTTVRQTKVDLHVWWRKDDQKRRTLVGFMEQMDEDLVSRNSIASVIRSDEEYGSNEESFEEEAEYDDEEVGIQIMPKPTPSVAKDPIVPQTPVIRIGSPVKPAKPAETSFGTVQMLETAPGGGLAIKADSDLHLSGTIVIGAEQNDTEPPAQDQPTEETKEDTKPEESQVVEEPIVEEAQTPSEIPSPAQDQTESTEETKVDAKTEESQVVEEPIVEEAQTPSEIPAEPPSKPEEIVETPLEEPSEQLSVQNIPESGETTEHTDDKPTEASLADETLTELTNSVLGSLFWPMEKYTKVSRIAEGGFGHVTLYKEKETDKKVAVKEFYMKDTSQGIPFDAIRELRILQDVNHPNIVNILEGCFHHKKLVIIYEYADSDLNQVSGLTGPEIKSLMRDLLRGIDYLHMRYIAHRDIKPANILLSGEVGVKLADFGMARPLGSPGIKSPDIITSWYRAPEIFLGSKYYGLAVDMWSIGCVFAELLKGSPLFGSKDATDLVILSNIIDLLGNPSEQIWENFTSLPKNVVSVSKKPSTFDAQMASLKSKNALSIDLLKQMLTWDPKQRITAEEALKHKYFHDALEFDQLPELKEKIMGKKAQSLAPKPAPKVIGEGVAKKLFDDM